MLLWTILSVSGAHSTAAAVTVRGPYQGFVGQYNGSKVLWSGTVMAGETAYMAASGTVGTGAGTVRYGWNCVDGIQGEYILTTRAWIINKDTSPAAVLPYRDWSRVCYFYMNQDDPSGGYINVLSSEVTLARDTEYVQPPFNSTPAPTTYPTIAPQFTPGPSASPSAACFTSPNPSDGVGPAVPTNCPTPTPTATPPPAHTWTCTVVDGGTDGRFCSDQAHVIFAAGALVTVAWTISPSGLDSNVNDPRQENAGFCTTVNSSTPITHSGSCFTLQVQHASNTAGNLCQKGGSGSGSTACSFTMNTTDLGYQTGWDTGIATGFSGADFEFWCGQTDWYYTTVCSVDLTITVGGVPYGTDGNPIPSASPSSSASPSGSGGTNPCYYYDPEREITYQVPCGSGNGGTGPGVPGPNGSPAGCVDGQPCGVGFGGTYTPGADCAFPGATVFVWEYAFWLGCIILQIPVAIANGAAWIVNQVIAVVSWAVAEFFRQFLLFAQSVFDNFVAGVNAYIVPDPTETAAAVATVTDPLRDRIPFSWIASAQDAIDGFWADVGDGSSLPTNTTVLGKTIPIGTAITNMTAQLTGARGIFLALLYIGFAYGVLNAALGFFGARGVDQQLDLGFVPRDW